MDNFDSFWAAYPRKVKKKDALKVWEKMSNTYLDQSGWPRYDKPALILDDIKNRLVLDDRWKRGFIPDPTTYLRGERWNDEIVKAPGQPKEKTPAYHQIYKEPDWMKR